MTNRDCFLDWDLLLERCGKAHPHIEIIDEIPQVRGAGVSVSLILARLNAYGSIRAVVEFHPELTEGQIREALSFAQTFLEVACEPHGSRRGSRGK